jgi:hypothetical protein
VRDISGSIIGAIRRFLCWSRVQPADPIHTAAAVTIHRVIDKAPFRFLASSVLSFRQLRNETMRNDRHPDWHITYNLTAQNQ